MQTKASCHERSYQIAQRAIELIKSYGSSAAPRSYEVWYTYVSGHRPLMNDELKRLATEHGSVSEDDIEVLYETHLSANRFSRLAERTSASVLGEIDQVMEMIDAAVGSTAQYGQSLEALSADLSGPIDRARIRQMLENLVVTTRTVAAGNRTLEARLKESRREIEGLREALESVRLEALTDALTGIANRKHLEEMLVKSIDQAAVERAPLALIVIDIDRFKHFNDSFGHLTGDQVLRLVATTMRESVKTKATLARFGGEEFAIILPDTLPEVARSTAERIRQSVMQRELVKRSTGESLGRVTVSLGVAAYRKGDTAMSLLERADQCMFAAKRGGRNRTVTDAEYVSDGSVPDAA